MLTYLGGFAQVPPNDECTTASILDNVVNFCSNNKEFTTVNAVNNDIWFKFVPLKGPDISITVIGNETGSTSPGGTLLIPKIELYTDCSRPLVSAAESDNNVTTIYKGGLIIGNTYYFKVSGANAGTFKLCVNNYTPILKPGQDCKSASFLCSKETFTQLNVSGAGLDQNEGRGTCLEPRPGIENSETNSAWYKWKAANNGTLTFVITPTAHDDIDWALYELGFGDDCNNKTVLRCAAGRGIEYDRACPNDALYVKTGMNLTSAEVSEETGCGHGGQDGFVKYIDMHEGHVYALLVNNFDRGNNGFTIEFGGTGEFVGPKAEIDFIANKSCTIDQNFTFNASKLSDYTRLKWTFGEGASIDSAFTPGPFTISYSSPGTKTAVLQAFNNKGCSVIDVQTFTVGLKPDKPSITANKPDFCIKDTIRLITPEVNGAVYHWKGPNNFSSGQREVRIPIEDFSVAGTYRLTTEILGCMSDETTIDISSVLRNPTAAFSTQPGITGKFYAPLKVTFINESTDADTYLWDFGDGSISAEINPTHEYTAKGDFEVTLTAFKSNICQATVVKGTFVIRTDIRLFIPNIFTPNADAVNDEFVITALTELNTYHISIFNRWGDQLFESSDVSDNWKGLYKGEPVPVGTYFYIIDAADMNNDHVKKSGSVTVIR